MVGKHKTRGRPAGNKKLRRLRSMTWLLAVQSRCGGKNNCQLDIMFGPEENGFKRSTANRLKMFEAVQENGSLPGDGTGKRKFDLVAKVNAEEGYEGTASIIHSPFWTLLEKGFLPLVEVREMVVDCTKRLGLISLPGNYQDDNSDELRELIKFEPDLSVERYFEYQQLGDIGYDVAMGDAFFHVEPSLDLIALFGALAIEAIYAGNMIVAKYQIDIFRNYLQEFCDQKWLSEFGNEVYQYADKRMLEILNTDLLNGLPTYNSMLANTRNMNPNSAIVALLTRHQRMLWRKRF